jgi:hypothetical protein
MDVPSLSTSTRTSAADDESLDEHDENENWILEHEIACFPSSKVLAVLGEVTLLVAALGNR